MKVTVQVNNKKWVLELTPTKATIVSFKEEYDGPSRGLGDTIHKVIKKATLGKVKPCLTCEERRKALNKKFSYAS